MRLFDSPKEYVIVFCCYVFIAFCKLYVLAFPDVAFLAASDVSRPFTYLNVLITVIFAVYLAVAWRKTSNRIERMVIALTGADCIVYLCRILYVFGVPWAGIPYEHIISAAIVCTAAAFAGVRTLEVKRLERAR